MDSWVPLRSNSLLASSYFTWNPNSSVVVMGGAGGRVSCWLAFLRIYPFVLLCEELFWLSVPRASEGGSPQL